VPLGEIQLGRASSCAVVFDHRSIGKHHARILRSEAQVVIEDLSSANGTFVNGKRVKTELLKHGDRIALAGVRTLRTSISTDFKASPASDSKSDTEMMPAFDQAWRTRLIWTPEELALIEANRGAIIIATPPHGYEVMKRPPALPVAQPLVDPIPEGVVTGDAPPQPTLVMTPTAGVGIVGTTIRGVEILNEGAIIQQLGYGPYVIGRSMDAMIRLDRNDREASRTHAILTVRPEGVAIENRSQNGTFHNQQRIESRTPVQDGDEIRCGHMVLIVRLVRS
jgi:pSer/pThr/pTyr-binding forkhead associated (FHA) protein